MSRKRKIEDKLAATLYTSHNLTIATIAEMFDVSEVAVHYALTRQGVERNRLNNPDKHSQSLSAIRSRLHRYQVELDEALEDGNKQAIREASQKVMREKQILAGRRADTQRRDDADDL